MEFYIILLCVFGCLIQGTFIVLEHMKKYVWAVCLKGTASCVFVTIGAIALSKSMDNTLVRLVFAGLCAGAVGDILLNLRLVFPKIGQKIFLAGIAAFLAGHILYLIALIPKCKSLLICIIVGAVIAAGILTYIFKTMSVKLSFKLFGILYIGAVVIMTSVAIGNLIAEQSNANILYAIGAVLFTLSDIVLIFNTFSGTTRFSLRITNLSLYYIGQLLIGCSLFFL